MSSAIASPRRGRPPKYLTPHTELGRWVRARGLSTGDFAERARVAADAAGIDPAHVPTAKSLSDLLLGRYTPSAPVMLVIRHATDGEIDLEHWVRDLSDRKPV